MESIELLGIRIDRVTMTETLQRIAAMVDEPRLHQICTPNPEFVMKAQKDADFRTVLNNADLNIPDGNGLLIAANWLETPLIERVAGSELVYHLAELSAEHGWRLFLLGAEEGVAILAGKHFQECYPNLIVAGCYAGSPDLAENDEIVAMINESSAEILYVAYGAPKQDFWIARNREQLPHVRVAIGVGGALDFVAGKSARAPLWIQKIGLEWLHRLVKEPWRWRRMVSLPQFGVRIARLAIQNRFYRSSSCSSSSLSSLRRPKTK